MRETLRLSANLHSAVALMRQRIGDPSLSGEFRKKVLVVRLSQMNVRVIGDDGTDLTALYGARPHVK